MLNRALVHFMCQGSMPVFNRACFLPWSVVARVPQTLGWAGVQSRPNLSTVSDTHAGVQSCMGGGESSGSGSRPPCQAGSPVSRPDSKRWASTHAGVQSRVGMVAAPASFGVSGVSKKIRHRLSVMALRLAMGSPELFVLGSHDFLQGTNWKRPNFKRLPIELRSCL